MGVRRHHVALGAILSHFVVRALEIVAAINDGRRGNLDRSLVRTLASDLGRDVDRLRKYAQDHQIKLEPTVTRNSVLALTLDQADERYLALGLPGYFDAALRLTHDLAHHLGGVLANVLKSDLSRALALNSELDATRKRIRNVSEARAQILDIDRSISQTLGLAFSHARALDRVCAQDVAGRLDISTVEGLADALLDGAMDDFTSADLTYVDLTGADLTGVRWSLSGTTWPPETNVKALLARSEPVKPGVLVVRRRGITLPPLQLAD
jgi:hypothetical protein